MHLPGAEVLKSVHPATKMCTPGAGCTLNFEHCVGFETQKMNQHGSSKHNVHIVTPYIQRMWQTHEYFPIFFHIMAPSHVSLVFAYKRPPRGS